MTNKWHTPKTERQLRLIQLHHNMARTSMQLELLLSESATLPRLDNMDILDNKHEHPEMTDPKRERKTKMRKTPNTWLPWALFIVFLLGATGYAQASYEKEKWLYTQAMTLSGIDDSKAKELLEKVIHRVPRSHPLHQKALSSLKALNKQIREAETNPRPKKTKPYKPPKNCTGNMIPQISKKIFNGEKLSTRELLCFKNNRILQLFDKWVREKQRRHLRQQEMKKRAMEQSQPGKNTCSYEHFICLPKK